MGLGCHERPTHGLWYRLRDVWDSDLEDGADVLRAQPGGARQGDLHHQVESKAREEASLGQVCYGVLRCGTVSSWHHVVPHGWGARMKQEFKRGGREVQLQSRVCYTVVQDVEGAPWRSVSHDALFSLVDVDP